MEKLLRAEKAMKNPFPGEIFDFELETKMQCVECNGVRYSKTKMNQLTVIAPVSSKVEKGTPVELSACLEKFFGMDMVTDT